MLSLLLRDRRFTCLLMIIFSLASSPHHHHASSPHDHHHHAFSLASSSPHHHASRFTCSSKLLHCHTFAALPSHSLSHRFSLPADPHFVPEARLLLLPIDCRCNGTFFEATLFKTCVKGDSFCSIAESLQGLTTCQDIREKNPLVAEQNLDENVQLLVPFTCSCPEQSVSNAEFLVSYPMSDRDSVSSLALLFNTSEKAILSVNNGSQVVPFTSVLIPFDHKPVQAPLAKPNEPKSPNVLVKHGKKKKLSKPARKKRLYMAISGTTAALSVLIILSVFGCLHLKKRSQMKTQSSISNKDPETQQLSLSVRTTSDKKVSFEGSQDGSMECQNTITIGTTTPRKRILEIFAFEDLERATEKFSSSNHIEGSVYHGLFKGKDLALKRVSAETLKKVDFGLLSDQPYFDHNLIRVLGTCFREENQDCYLVLEYAKNGSLRDWIQNKLAIKNQFIESCYCFLAWKQRIRIILDVAMALKYMHQINYIHGNLKSRNIFLDEDLRAKVGNFGMSKCITITEESGAENCSTAATDVLAYGIILLEVLTGETPEMAVGVGEKVVDKETLREMMDSALGESYSVDSAFEIAKIARDCIAEEAGSRPNASEIAERVARLVEEEDEDEDESTLVSESSSKPLVNKAVS